MTERSGPQIYAIAAHRGFADALVAGLIPRYADTEFGLARLTLLLPSRRAERIVTEAFVRLSGGGLLLPRMAMIGDLDLDETLGPLLDPMGTAGDIAPAANPTRRWLRLADVLAQVMGDRAPPAPGLLRLAHETARTMDRLAIEGLDLADLLDGTIAGIVGEQAHHWIDSTRDFAAVLARWRSELAAAGEIDPPQRRNQLFEAAARRWRTHPPQHPVVAAGVTSASPPLARLLRVVSELPRGAVILPDLDLDLADDVWQALGSAGQAAGPDDPPFGADDAFVHPQYHLKLLLNRMGIARSEVRPWHRAGLAAAPPQRSRTISSLFLPPAASAGWAQLPPERRRLSGVRLVEAANPAEEAQAIAILIREALTVAERRTALITPDRSLAARVIAHLQRWGIAADDSAGQPLGQTRAGRLFLLLAEVAAERAAPVPLLALLQHPLVATETQRREWLEAVRLLDLALRGPRAEPGLAPLRAAVARVAAKPDRAWLADWWQALEAVLVPLVGSDGPRNLAGWLDGLSAAAEALGGEAVWGGADGRALAGWIDDLRQAASAIDLAVKPADLAQCLRDAMDRVAVRPPWGGHPRVAIYGLLEARMSRADLVICAGLTEGSWPAAPAAEPLLPPAVLRALGVPAGEFRIGLAAHDLAGALGAPEVVLSWARRDEGGPVRPSRFVLRVQALLGDLAGQHQDQRLLELARQIDFQSRAAAYPRPMPLPSPEQRDVALAVTAIDRLRADPYQFYARAILRLRPLDPLDAEPSAAWKGTVVHAVLDRWHKEGGRAGALLAIAAAELAEMQAHPLVRSLWWPRLAKGLEWIDADIAALAQDGRVCLVSEQDGVMTFDGVKVYGRADRIDRLADGRLAIVDYKTGSAPSVAMVAAGFALQLGTLGLIAEQDGFAGANGVMGAFEYWSLSKYDKNTVSGFGRRTSPILGELDRAGVAFETFLDQTADYLSEAIARWIKGTDPFTARLNPNLPSYAEYDQLMRLDEWQARGEDPA